MSCNHLEDSRGIGHRSCKGAYLVERGSERDESIAGDAPVGRLEPDDSAERRGLADRTAGVGSQGGMGHACGNGHAGTAARSPGNPAFIDRIQDRTVRGILGGRSHGKLIHVRLPDDHGILRLQAGDGGCIIERDKVLKDL